MAVGAPGAWRDAVAPGPAGGDELRAGMWVDYQIGGFIYLQVYLYVSCLDMIDAPW